MSISVEDLAANQFLVTVSAASTTRHTVTVRPEYLEKIAGAGADPREVLRRSFEFLLDHESNTSILSSFDLSVIQRYFSDYEKTMQQEFGAC